MGASKFTIGIREYSGLAHTLIYGGTFDPRKVPDYGLIQDRIPTELKTTVSWSVLPVPAEGGNKTPAMYLIDICVLVM